MLLEALKISKKKNKKGKIILLDDTQATLKIEYVRPILKVDDVDPNFKWDDVEPG